MAPTSKQQEIIKIFADSKDLDKIVVSEFGNFVLQHTRLNYCPQCKEAKLILIEAIINCLYNITEFKIQQKWGNEILVHNLKHMQGEKADELISMLDDFMQNVQSKPRSVKNTQQK